MQYTEEYGPDEIAMNRDVGDVAAYLKGQYTADDSVVSVFPIVDLLEYYFRVDGVPLEYLRTRPAGREQYLVVANDAIGQSLDVVLAKAHIPLDTIASAHVLKRFEHTYVYRVRLKPSGSL